MTSQASTTSTPGEPGTPAAPAAADAVAGPGPSGPASAPTPTSVPTSAAVPASTPAVQPVVLGGDIGAYSLARSFHEGYGVRSVVLSSVLSCLVRHSRAIENELVDTFDDADAVVERLHAVADRLRQQHPDRPLLLLASADRLVRLLVTHRERLEDRYVLPYPRLGLLEQLTDKAGFGRVCAELGVPYPRTVEIDVTTTSPGRLPDLEDLQFPMFAKAASTVAYHQVSFPGKRKGYEIADEGALLDLLDRLRGAGYGGSFLVQERIPGDDQGMRILTCYCDRAGKVRYSSMGWVVVEEHAPGAIGNPAAILTVRDDATVEHARRLLEHVGWTGYANFDLKHDPRTGRTVFFELNPRLGRSNYYVAAGGQNPVEPYVREYLQGADPLPPGAPGHSEAGGLYTVLPRPLLARYATVPELRAGVAAAYRARRVRNPLANPAETDPRRRAYVALAQLNQYRKFRRYYPVATARRLAEQAGR